MQVKKVTQVMRGMWVFTRIIWSICDIRIIWNLKYFELNNNPMRVMQGGFEASIGPSEYLSRGEAAPTSRGLAIKVYMIICKYSNISNIFLIFKHAYNLRSRL